MLTKRLSTNRDGDLVLTIKVTGAQDIYRFASSMLSAQCEFARAGVLALHSLRDRLQPHQWNYLYDVLGGPATRRIGRKRWPRC